MVKIINGNKIAKAIEKGIKEKINKMPSNKPGLAVVLVGSHKPSALYVRKKQESAKRVGINFFLYKFPETTKEKILLAYIKKIQKNKQLNGIIIQLPLPAHLHTQKILDAINPQLDVDCLTTSNQKKLLKANALILPPTPNAILKIIESLKIDLKNKKITLMGYGRLVGKPLAKILKARKIKFTVCQKGTKNIKKICRQSDILITAVGKKDLIRGADIKPGAVIIDAGSSFYNKKMYGDVNFVEASEKAGWITPVPGGVGPITVALLLYNTMLCALKRK